MSNNDQYDEHELGVLQRWMKKAIERARSHPPDFGTRFALLAAAEKLDSLTEDDDGEAQRS